MTVAETTIKLDPRLLRKVDALVRTRLKSRSEAIRSILSRKVGHVDPNSLKCECAKLDLQNHP